MDSVLFLKVILYSQALLKLIALFIFKFLSKLWFPNCIFSTCQGEINQSNTLTRIITAIFLVFPSVLIPENISIFCTFCLKHILDMTVSVLYFSVYVLCTYYKTCSKKYFVWTLNFNCLSDFSVWYLAPYTIIMSAVTYIERSKKEGKLKEENCSWDHLNPWSSI